ncbi:MAG: DUF4398 domain-containing protein [Myxococcales bacterium]|nr:MAG: DUF4398 domain-containing protein [Myxococcales bacterium]
MKTFTLLIALGCMACASYPAPTEKMVSSEAQIRAAREVGVQQNPQAGLHLQLAEEQLEKAKALMADDENEMAEYMLMRADADAQLALALARETEAKNRAEEALDQIRSLQTKTAN